MMRYVRLGGDGGRVAGIGEGGVSEEGWMVVDKMKEEKGHDVR